MPILSIDIETYSDVDLSKCGVYAYSDSPNFEILLFAYAFDEEPTQIVDLACGERLPERVLAALEDPAITKAAFNAQFERTCISKYLERRLSPSGWQCTAVQSAMLALPLSLDMQPFHWSAMPDMYITGSRLFRLRLRVPVRMFIWDTPRTIMAVFRYRQARLIWQAVM